MLLGTALWSAGSLLVVRLCGYRLVHHCAEGAADQPALPALAPSVSAHRRFALALLPLALVFMALGATVPE